MKIVWAPRSRAHLEHLYTYIANDNPDAARNIVARIVDAVENLADFPESGRAGRVPHTRELVIPGTPYLVVYRVRNAVLEVIAVLHEARKWPHREPVSD